MSQPTTSMWPPYNHGITQLEKLKAKLNKQQKNMSSKYLMVPPKYAFESIRREINRQLKELRK